MRAISIDSNELQRFTSSPKLGELGFKTSNPTSTKHSFFVELFSSDLHVKVLCQNNKVRLELFQRQAVSDEKLTEVIRDVLHCVV
jgi:hypothetical protein